MAEYYYSGRMLEIMHEQNKKKKEKLFEIIHHHEKIIPELRDE